MLTVEEARRLSDADADVAALLKQYAEVELFYREAVAAMSVSSEPEPAPVLNSSDLMVSFQSSSAMSFDLTPGKL